MELGAMFYGYVPSRQTDVDYVYGMFGEPNATFEDEFSGWDKYLPPVENQGSRPMCVVFAGNDIKYIQEYHQTGKDPESFSKKYTYGNRDAIRGDYMGEGMNPENYCFHLVSDGVPPEKDMPGLGTFVECFNEVRLKKELLKEKSRPNRILSYVRLNTKEEAMSAIKNWGPVHLCINVRRSFRTTGSDGIVHDITDFMDPITGGHDMMAFGWKTIKGIKHFKVKNSWSDAWGDKGFCYIPIDYFDIVEMWGMTDWVPEFTPLQMDTRVVRVNDRLMVPIRFITEAIGAKVEWDEKNKIADIIIPPHSTETKLRATENSDVILIGRK